MELYCDISLKKTCLFLLYRKADSRERKVMRIKEIINNGKRFGSLKEHNNNCLRTVTKYMR